LLAIIAWSCGALRFECYVGLALGHIEHAIHHQEFRRASPENAALESSSIRRFHQSGSLGLRHVTRM